MEYPKIETLFDRDEKTFKVKEEAIRLPEFSNVKKWWITEKIDGTNVRVVYNPSVIHFHGRTENAQMPTFLLEYLQKTFTLDKFRSAFSELAREVVVTLYGEGYGAKIQKGGNYRPNDVCFRLIDVLVGNWWLEPENIEDVALKMGIKTVPVIGVMTLEEAVQLIKSKPMSIVAKEDSENLNYPMEGIVARSYPLMLRRNGERVIWKLKNKDFG